MPGKRFTFGDPTITIDGSPVEKEDIDNFVCSSDVDQADMADITLSNLSKYSGKLKANAKIEVKMKLEGESEERLFTGSLNKMKPTRDTHLPSTVNVIAMNKMHDLTRQRVTGTNENLTDKEIISKVCQEAGLTAEFGRHPPTLKHEHLWQPNMSAFDFIRLRAARSGRVCYVEDTKLYFVKRQLDEGPVAQLTFTFEGTGGGGGSNDRGALESFEPQMGAAGQIKKCQVYGWDPVKKEPIVGKFEQSNSPLGNEAGGSAYGDSPNHDVHDVPVRSKQEADEVAESILMERAMNFITGSARSRGNPKLKRDAVVQLKCDDKRYDGKYYIAGVTHTFSRTTTGLGGGAAMGGYSSDFRFQRDAGK